MKYFQLFLTISSLIIFPAKIFAQDTLKTKARDWTTELNVNLLQGELKLNNAVDQLKVRYFITGNLAIRAAFDFSNKRIEESSVNNYGIDPYSIISIMKKTSLGMNLGIEKHFAGTKRLSPYLGAEVAFTDKLLTHIVETSDRINTVDGAWASGVLTIANTYPYRLNQFQEKASLSAGVNLLAGFDYYFSEKIYLGYEMIYSLNYLVYPTISVTEVLKPGSTGTTSNYPEYDSDEWQFGPKLINGIRLGFVF